MSVIQAATLLWTAYVVVQNGLRVTVMWTASVVLIVEIDPLFAGIILVKPTRSGSSSNIKGALKVYQDIIKIRATKTTQLLALQ